MKLKKQSKTRNTQPQELIIDNEEIASLCIYLGLKPTAKICNITPKKVELQTKKFLKDSGQNIPLLERLKPHFSEDFAPRSGACIYLLNHNMIPNFHDADKIVEDPSFGYLAELFDYRFFGPQVEDIKEVLGIPRILKFPHLKRDRTPYFFVNGLVTKTIKEHYLMVLESMFLNSNPFSFEDVAIQTKNRLENSLE